MGRDDGGLIRYAGAAPDGYTQVTGSVSQTIAPALSPSILVPAFATPAAGGHATPGAR
jgi:hypothetical protein